MLAPDNRVILISGANRGIGHAVANTLYDVGYTLSLGARNPDTLANVIGTWAPERVLMSHYDAEKQETPGNRYGFPQSFAPSLLRPTGVCQG